MKKTIITTEKLLEEGKYYKQLPAYGIFCATGVFFFLISLIYIKDAKSLLMGAIFVWLPFLIPFGYFLGIKKIVETKKKIRKVENGEFYILEKLCTDISIVSNKDSSNDTLLHFGENEGAWVSRSKLKELKEGDVCYVVYLEGNEKPSMIFSQRKYELEETLKSKTRREDKINTYDKEGRYMKKRDKNNAVAAIGICVVFIVVGVMTFVMVMNDKKESTEILSMCTAETVGVACDFYDYEVGGSDTGYQTLYRVQYEYSINGNDYKIVKDKGQEKKPVIGESTEIIIYNPNNLKEVHVKADLEIDSAYSGMGILLTVLGSVFLVFTLYSEVSKRKEHRIGG